MTDTDSLRLLPAQLRRIHDPTTFEFECTDELIPLTEFIGQDRALRSLQFGLGVHKSGYNVFVTGLTGSGKATAIMDYIRRAVEERRAADTAVPSDWCYVYNFDDPDRPNAVSLPAGSGRQLRTDLEELLAGIRANVGRAFSSEEYEHQKRDLFENGQREAQRSIEEAQRKAEAAGFLLRFSPAGIALLPSLDGQPMTPEQFAALPPEQRQQTADRERSLTGVVSEVGERLRAIERDVSKAVRELDRRIAEWVMSAAFDALAKQFEPHEEVVRFLSQLREFSLGSVDLFREQAPPSPLPQLPQFAAPQGQPDPFVAFRCNSFVDNSAQVGPPIIVESNPTWTNLFGRVERRAFLGTYLSDHMMLKAGSVHRANGGYLIVNLIDVMMKPGSWDGLKRLIRTREVGLEDPMEQYGFLTPQALRPEPVPIDVKLVVTGDPMSYFLLSAQDEEFWEMFKVKADFNHQIDRTAENELAYAGFVCAAATREGLRHFDRTGVARLIEQGSRMVDDQEKLSARFGRLRDIIVEADYWAGQSGSELVSTEHVERAINERVYRLNLVEERLRDLIRRGVIMVDVEGAVVGQVNGLAVLDFGDFSFGRPSRITARTFLGQRGVVSIDRESQLSGKIHDKGVLILGGYLGSTYARDKPLSLRQHLLRAGVRFRRWRQRLTSRALRDTVQPRRSAGPAGTGDDRVREPEGRSAADRRSESEDRGLPRRLPRHRP